MRFKLIILFIVLLGLAACEMEQPTVPEALSTAPSETATAMATNTVEPTITSTAAPTTTPTVTPTITPTTTPTPTITPTPRLPVTFNTPMPYPLAAILPDNAGLVTELARWGRGIATDMAYSPDGKILAVSTGIGIYLYDSETQEEIRRIETNEFINSIAFSPDGQTILSGSNAFIRLWQVSDGLLLQTIEATHPVLSIALSSDGQILATGDDDGVVTLWQTADGTAILRTAREQSGPIVSLAFSPNGKTIAATAWRNNLSYVRAWNAQTGSLLWEAQNRKNSVAGNVVFLPDGDTLVHGSWFNVHFWGVNNGVLLRDIKNSWQIMSLSVSPNGQFLAIYVNDPNGNHEVTLIRVDNGYEYARAEVPIAMGFDAKVLFSPDGNTLAFMLPDGDANVLLWKVSSDGYGGYDLVPVGSIEQANSIPPIDLTFSQDGQTLISGIRPQYLSVPATITIRQVVDGVLLQQYLIGEEYQVGEDGQVVEEGSSFYRFFLSPDGQVLGLDEESHIRLLRTSDFSLICRTDFRVFHDNNPRFSPDGAIFSVGGVRLVYLYNASDCSSLNMSYETWGALMIFSPDMQLAIASASDYNLNVWQLSDGSLLYSPTWVSYATGIGDGYVTLIRFSPDGQQVTIITANGTVRIWDVNSWTILSTVRIQDFHLSGVDEWWFSSIADGIKYLSLSPDGKVLAASDGNTIFLWDTTSGNLLSTLHGHTDTVSILSFSPDGYLLASAGEDGTIRLWGIK